jgi:hypothetical protein
MKLLSLPHNLRSSCHFLKIYEAPVTSSLSLSNIALGALVSSALLSSALLWMSLGLTHPLTGINMNGLPVG